MKQLRLYWLLINVLFGGPVLLAQPAAFDERLTDESPVVDTEATFLGITILGNPSMRFSSTSDYQNGVSLDHNTLQLTVSLGLTWSIQLRALDDLRYQEYVIPVSGIGVQSLGLGAKSEFFLSTTNQTLASGFATSLLNAIMPIRYRAIGGTNFLKPAGTYTTTLVFSYSTL